MDAATFDRRRSELQASFGPVYQQLLELFLKNDPFGLTLGDLDYIDEYEYEVLAVLPRIPACETVGDIKTLVRKAFVRTSGKKAVHDASKNPDRWQIIAERIFRDILPTIRN